jgi:hypothetical protein
LSSLVSFCIIHASTKCCSIASISSDSSMNIGSIDVTHGHVCSLTHQHLLLLCKNSIANVPIVSMSWIIICANYIFSLYAFPYAHSEDDDECGDDLTANNWIFNKPKPYSSQFLFLLLIFSTIQLPPPTFVCVHSSTPLFPLIFIDAPPSSLMDSIMNPKVKTTKGEWVRACSLTHNTLGVEGCARAPGWD